jgi:hypothetical protein
MGTGALGAGGPGKEGGCAIAAVTAARFVVLFVFVAMCYVLQRPRCLLSPIS